MNWLARQWQKAARFVAKRALKYAGVPLRDPALIELFGMKGQTQAGLYVDENNAYNYAAYFRGVNLIARSIALVLWSVWKEGREEGDAPEFDHNTNLFFSVGPNPNMTWFQFTDMLTAHALTWGNGYAWIERDKDDRPVALWPVPPNQVTPKYDKKKTDGSVIYEYKATAPGDSDATYKSHEILHIAGYGFDGLQGYSVVACARESIALGLSTEKFGASFFGNNAVPGGIVTHPADLDLKAKDNIREEIEDVAGGSQRARRVVVLDEGMKYQQIGIPPEDGQFLQTRQFQVREIARWLSVPPHLLYDLDEANFSTTESQGLDFKTYTLEPWIETWAGEMKRKLLTMPEQVSGYFYKPDVSRIVVMEENTKWDLYSKQRNLGYYTLNDIKRKEREQLMPPEVGDSRVTPSTMIPLEEKPGKPVDPKVINDTIVLIRSLGTDKVTAMEVFKATMPDADESLYVALCNSLQFKG